MLTVNMQKPYHPYNRKNHPQISHGVDKDTYKTGRPSLQELMMDNGAVGDGPKHLDNPHRLKNYPGHALQYTEPVAKYNRQGNFAVSEKLSESRRRTMHRMNMDCDLVRLTNKTRKQK